MKKLLVIVLSIAMIVANGTPTFALSQTVNPTASTVYINGTAKNFEAYNISGNNFFKLRDLAYVLNGTEKQFGVGYNNATKSITLTSNESYTAVGGEMSQGDGKPRTATPTHSRIYIDNKELNLIVYNIGGNNFFKLRDLMEILDVYVGYDNSTKTITLDTSKSYVPEEIEPTIDIGEFGVWFYYTYCGQLKGIKSDGSEKSTLIDGSPANFNVIDDWIYYTDHADGHDGELYRVRTDGTNKELLLDVYCSSVYVFGEWIYFIEGRYPDDTQLYRMRINGTNKTKLSDDNNCVGIYAVVDGWIYYESDGIVSVAKEYYNPSQLMNDDALYNDPNVLGVVSSERGIVMLKTDGAGLYRIRTDGTGRTRMVGRSFNGFDDGGFAWSEVIRKSYVQIVGDWVYYTAQTSADYDFKIYKIKMDGKGEQAIKLSNDDALMGMRVIGDWIYYINTSNNSDKWKIFKIRTDGTSKSVVIDDNPDYFINSIADITEDWILYWRSTYEHVTEMYYERREEYVGMYRINVVLVRIDGTDQQIIETHYNSDWFIT